MLRSFFSEFLIKEVAIRTSMSVSILMVIGGIFSLMRPRFRSPVWLSRFQVSWESGKNRPFSNNFSKGNSNWARSYIVQLCIKLGSPIGSLIREFLSQYIYTPSSSSLSSSSSSLFSLTLVFCTAPACNSLASIISIFLSVSLGVGGAPFFIVYNVVTISRGQLKLLWVINLILCIHCHDHLANFHPI